MNFLLCSFVVYILIGVIKSGRIDFDRIVGITGANQIEEKQLIDENHNQIAELTAKLDTPIHEQLTDQDVLDVVKNFLNKIPNVEQIKKRNSESDQKYEQMQKESDLNEKNQARKENDEASIKQYEMFKNKALKDLEEEVKIFGLKASEKIKARND